MSAFFDRTVNFARRRWWVFAVLAFLVLSYTAAGFLLVPRLAKSSIENYVREDLGRQIAIERVTFNPYTLTAEIGGFALAEADGSPIASFDLLHVNASLSSIFNRAWTFSEIRIERPDLRAVVAPDGTLNLARLVPPSSEPPPPADQTAAIPAIRIGTFSIAEGSIGYEERVAGRSEPFTATLTPITFTLEDFRTAPDFQNSYVFEGSTLAGERLRWAGQFSVQPLGSAGNFALTNLQATTIASYLRDVLPFALPSGVIDLEGTYRATLAGTLGASIELPDLRVRDIGIAPKNVADAEPWITLPAVQLAGTAVSLENRTLTVERIVVNNPKANIWREPNGDLNLQQLFGMTPAAAPTPATADAPAAPAEPAGPLWTVSVGTLDVRDAALDIEDRTTRPATRIAIAPIALTVFGYSTAPDTTVQINTSMTVGQRGRVSAQGDVQLTTLDTTLQLDIGQFDLPPFQPYVAASTGMQLLSGQLVAKGTLRTRAAPPRGESALQFAGDVAVLNLATRDTALRQDFVKWASLQINGIDYRQDPGRLFIDRIVARRPYGRVVVSSDQTLNVVAVLSPPAAAQRPQAAAQRPAARAAAPARAAQPMPMRIRSVTVQDGTMDFADFSVEPNFAATILALNGTVTGLSSAPNTRADVKLTGNVGEFSPVDITGQVNLLSAAVYSDVALNFRNIELTTFNPYSGKYAGYNISKGKLTTELRYKVENRALDAQHHIVLDQLEFGQATNSQDAVPLPVRLAVALLKDRNGIIDIELPVSGSLDDPQFRIGPIVWQAFVGLLTKIVTAPFALLGSVFGGGEDLAYVEFAAGSAALSADQQEKISMLAGALGERPELRLDIPLQTITDADADALSNAAFDAALMAALPPDPAAAQAPQARMAALAQIYQQQFGAPPAYPAVTSPDMDVVALNTAFLEDQLRPRFAANDAAKAALARARADAVQGALVTSGMIAPERIFLTERASGAGGASGSARMELSLQ